MSQAVESLEIHGAVSRLPGKVWKKYVELDKVQLKWVLALARNVR
jgi:hypothetical protein